MTLATVRTPLAGPRRRLAAALGASALAVTLAGCGGGGAATETADAVPADGYDRTELLAAMKQAVAKNDTTHIEMALDQTGPAGQDGQSGQPVQSVRGEGEVSYAGDETAMQMRLDMSGAGMPGAQGGQGMQGMGGSLEVRLVKGSIYLSAPGMTPPGTFLRVPAGSPMMQQFNSFTQGDPMSTFDAFEAGLTKADYRGEEEVDGETLGHYRLTVDTMAAAKAQGMDPQAARGMPQQLAYDLWIDGEDLMRRVETDTAGVRVEVTMDAWGEPVDITAPPKADVQRMPDIARG